MISTAYAELGSDFRLKLRDERGDHQEEPQIKWDVHDNTKNLSKARYTSEESEATIHVILCLGSQIESPFSSLVAKNKIIFFFFQIKNTAARLGKFFQRPRWNLSIFYRLLIRR